MLRATFRPGRSANAQGKDVPVKTGFFSGQVLYFLQQLSRLSCEHPVRTVALIAIVASSCYISLLESNLFEPPATTSNAAGQLSFDAFLAGSKILSVGPATQWKWQNGDGEAPVLADQVCEEQTLPTDMETNRRRSPSNSRF